MLRLMYSFSLFLYLCSVVIAPTIEASFLFMYIFRVPDEGYVKYSSSQGAVEFTDNWYLFKSVLSMAAVREFVNTVLAGFKVEVLKVEEVQENGLLL